MGVNARSLAIGMTFRLRRIGAHCHFEIRRPAIEPSSRSRTGLPSGKSRRPTAKSSHARIYFPKNGNSVRNSSALGRRPYSQISNASAYFTALPRGAPYHVTSASRKRSATAAQRPP